MLIYTLSMRVSFDWLRSYIVSLYQTKNLIVSLLDNDIDMSDDISNGLLHEIWIPLAILNSDTRLSARSLPRDAKARSIWYTIKPSEVTFKASHSNSALKSPVVPLKAAEYTKIRTFSKFSKKLLIAMRPLYELNDRNRSGSTDHSYFSLKCWIDKPTPGDELNWSHKAASN